MLDNTNTAVSVNTIVQYTYNRCIIKYIHHIIKTYMKKFL